MAGEAAFTAPGVVEVNPVGGYKKQVVVSPDPVKMLAFGVSHTDVLAALRELKRSSGPW